MTAVVNTTRLDQRLDIERSPLTIEAASDLSDGTMVILTSVMNTLLLVIGLFGVPANALNILVFTKMGLGDHMNLKLCVLACADLAALICVLVSTSGNLLAVAVTDLPVDMSSLDADVFTWAWDYFAGVSTWVTVYISSERCLCVVFPLAFRNHATLPKSICVLVLISLLMLTRYIKPVMAIEFGWSRISPDANVTKLRVIYTEKYVDAMEEFAIQGLVLRPLCLIALVTFTGFMIKELRKSVKFRQAASSAPKFGEHSAVSARDRVLVEMVAFIAIVFITTSTPAVLFNFSIYFGVLHLDNDRNKLAVMYLVTRQLAAVNAAINIFVYHRLSSNFRKVLNNILVVE